MGILEAQSERRRLRETGLHRFGVVFDPDVRVRADRGRFGSTRPAKSWGSLAFGSRGRVRDRDPYDYYIELEIAAAVHRSMAYGLRGIGYSRDHWKISSENRVAGCCPALI